MEVSPNWFSGTVFIPWNASPLCHQFRDLQETQIHLSEFLLPIIVGSTNVSAFILPKGRHSQHLRKLKPKLMMLVRWTFHSWTFSDVWGSISQNSQGHLSFREGILGVLVQFEWLMPGLFRSFILASLGLTVGAKGSRQLLLASSANPEVNSK